MKRFHPIQRHWLAWVCLSSLAIGCSGSGDAPPLAAVTGKVTLRGRPVNKAIVVFHPEKGPMATGQTDADGSYTVKTGNLSGVTIGKCKVTVTKNIQTGPTTAMTPDDMMKMQKENQGKTPSNTLSEVPVRYSSPDTSALAANVTRDSSKNVFDFQLSD